MDLIASEWKNLQEKYQLDDEQLMQCKRYAQLLSEWNRIMNLTAITDPLAVINDHFADSLEASVLFDTMNISCFADVGAGAGFPGMPLLIKYPHMFGIFIEVNGKKRHFLQTVLDELGLSARARISDLDWRTFLRQEKGQIDLFVARASLRPDELVRALSLDLFKNSMIMYWASVSFVPEDKEKPFVERQIWYDIGDKKRQLVCFGKK